MTNKLIEEKTKQILKQDFHVFGEFGMGIDVKKLEQVLKTSLNEVVEERYKQIYKDLMKVADEGEYEDLRREVERYFKKIIN